MSVRWRIEYTRPHRLKKRRREVLERLLAEAIGNVEKLLKDEKDDEFVLGDSGFTVEST
mgnify:CR=1 FL=1